jgi:hypothetical protein
MNIRHSQKKIEHQRLDILEDFQRRSAQRKLRLSDISLTTWVCTVTAAFFCFWIAEALLSTTSLITPINAQLSYTLRGVGFVTGLIVGLSFALTEKAAALKKVFIVVFTPFLAATGFEGLAWRMANMWEFGLSSSPFEQTAYPVKRADPNTSPTKSFYKKDTLEIDPFETGVATDIPVPSDQFRQIWLTADEYCVVVRQRRAANGAIQIHTDGQIMFGTPAPVELVPCGNAKRPMANRR